MDIFGTPVDPGTLFFVVVGGGFALCLMATLWMLGPDVREVKRLIGV